MLRKSYTHAHTFTCILSFVLAVPGVLDRLAVCAWSTGRDLELQRFLGFGMLAEIAS